MDTIQRDKAAIFRQLHNAENMLILPNTWDVLSSRLIASLGFPAIATASAAIAISNGYRDGEQIPFGKLIGIVSQITSAVEVPVTVDFEKGYSSNDATLRDNVKRLLDAGAVGINIEDGATDRKGLVPTAEHSRKIELIRNTALQQNGDIVINARTDIFLQGAPDKLLSEAIERGNAYARAGAHSFFPVMVGDYQHIAAIVDEVALPVNVILFKAIGDLKKLQQIGVKRVSLGPGVLKYMLTKIKSMAEGLQRNSTELLFAEELITTDDATRLGVASVD